MKFIDTHCHIYYDKYKDDLDQVVDRAIENNIEKIICVGVDLDSSVKSIEIAEKYNIVYATAGFHPHESKQMNTSDLKEIEQILKHNKIVALGEIGLDYHYTISDKKTQVKVFREQLELAKSINLPVIIHNRNSDDDLLNCLQLEKNKNGVIHCFASNLNLAKQLIALNMHLSFTGLITFVKELENVIKNIPLSKIMIETDSPYLTPIPNRGKRNEPYMVKYVAEKIAHIRNLPVEDIATATTNTANNFFKFE